MAEGTEQRDSADQAKPTNRRKRGFGSMDPEKQREIARKGGQASPGNFKNNPKKASEAGKKGGSK